MQQHGGNWYDWYVGIAADPRGRLFSDHNVTEQGGVWIHSGDTANHSIARQVEQHFLSQGCDGGSGGGSHMTTYVYAYKKTTFTNENN